MAEARGFRLALAQTPGELDGVGARLDWLRQTLADVAETGADLLLLPELFACGYNIGEALAVRAEPLDGPLARTMSGLAQRSGVAIHYGWVEGAGSHLYNAAQCALPDGSMQGHHRKLAVPPGEERRFFSPGAGCRLFTFKGVRIATLICYDAEFLETVRHVAAKGAQLVLVPTALGAAWAWVAQRMIPTRAYENDVFLAYANHAGVENGLRYVGQSVIAAPDGVELARAGERPEVLYATLDMARVAAAQARLPYLQDRLTLDLGGA